MKREISITYKGTNYSLSLDRQGSSVIVTHGGKEYHVAIPSELASPPTPIQKASQSSSHSVGASSPSTTSLTNAGSPSSDSTTVAAPMAGTIKEIVAKPNTAVSIGDVIIIMEAMKMEVTISSKNDGNIKKILVAIGDNVSQGQPLAEME